MVKSRLRRHINPEQKMKLVNLTFLLNFKRLTWLMLPTSFSINSAAYAVDSASAQANDYSEQLTPSLNTTLSNFITNVPLNAVAWLSLSAVMAILFFSKHPLSKTSFTSFNKVD
jgi:hypothetical protein